MHDDLFDFFYEAIPGYEEVGRRRVLLGCWGAFQDPDVCNFNYRDMTSGVGRCSSRPGVVVDGKLVTNDLVDINLGIRILLGSSYYDSWEDQEMFVTRDPLGNPVDRNHPWNQHTIPQPQKRDFDDKYSWVDVAPLVRRHGPPGPRHRRRPHRPAVVDGAVGPRRHRLRQGDRHSVEINLPEDGAQARGHFEWKIPQWSNTIERDRARTYFQAYAAAAALYFVEKALRGPGRAHQDVGALRGTRRGHRLRVHRSGAGVLSHHMVIQGGKIANYHPYPPTPWNANPRDSSAPPDRTRTR